MYLQGVDSIYDLIWAHGPDGDVTYGDVFLQNEVEMSTFNFEYADVDFCFPLLISMKMIAAVLLIIIFPFQAMKW